MTVIVALTTPLPFTGSPDGEALLALERATQQRPLTLDGLLHEAATGAQGVVLVARSEGTIVGMASARLLGDEAHVIRFAVDAQYRRRGIGRSLLGRLIGWAVEAGAVAVLLEVRSGNVEALGLYTSFGAVVEGVRPRYYPDGEAALLLRLIPPLADRPAQFGRSADR